VIDVDELMLTAACRNIGGGSSNIMLLYSDLNIPGRVDFYLHVDLKLRRVCTLNKNNITNDEAGVVHPKERALKSTNNSAGGTMRHFLTDNGLTTFLSDTGLDVDAVLKFLSTVNSERIKSEIRRQKIAAQTKAKKDTKVWRSKQKMDYRKSNNDEDAYDSDLPLHNDSHDNTISLHDDSHDNTISLHDDSHDNTISTISRTEASSPLRKKTKKSCMSRDVYVKLIEDINETEQLIDTKLVEMSELQALIESKTDEMNLVEAVIKSAYTNLESMKQQLEAENDMNISEKENSPSTSSNIFDQALTPVALDNTLLDSDAAAMQDSTIAADDNTESLIKLHIIANGQETCELDIDKNDQIIFIHRLKLLFLRRRKNDRGFRAVKGGRLKSWIPNGMVLVAKQRHQKLKHKEFIVDNLVDLFSGEKCKLSEEAMRILASFNLHNYGGSDEATEMIVAGVLMALFHDIGFDVDHSKLAKACPSQTSISDAELRLSVDVIIKVLHEMKNDGVKYISIMTDHGHRAGQDHFVIIVTWAGRDNKGKRCLKFFCPSIDSAGHTSMESAEAVNNVVSRLFSAMGIEVVAATADAGGGGSIDNIRPELIRLGIMKKKNGKFANCVLHALNKALELAVKGTMGGEGLGCRSPTQMVFVFAKLMDHIRSKGGVGVLDKLWETIRDELLVNDDWKHYSQMNFTQAWGSFMVQVTSLDGLEDDLLDLLKKSPRGIQIPVWTRWQTMIKTTEIFLKNYVQIYFLAIAVKFDEKNDSYGWQLACTLISLMNEKAKPMMLEDTMESIDRFTDTFSTENVTERGGDEDNNFGVGSSPPAFYTMLLFFDGFCKYTFTYHFEIMKKNNPYYGDGTYGQLAQFMSLQAYLIVRDLNVLVGEDGNGDGWRGIDEFGPYCKAISNIPSNTDHAANKEFYNILPRKFIGEYRRAITKHLIERWTGGELGHYTLAGNPRLAQELAYALVSKEEEIKNLNDENINSVQYQFPNEVVTLDAFHRRGAVDERVNIREFMTFFVNRTNMREIYSDDFVRENWKAIEKLALARADGVFVRLWDYKDDGVIDQDTWGGYDYKPFIDSITTRIAIHSSHQQRCENHVQLAALASKTNVGEKRRTWRAISISYLIRRFNQLSLNRMRSKETDPMKKHNKRRERGSIRTREFAAFIEEFNNGVEEARNELGPLRCKAVRKSLECSDEKVSAKERRQYISHFKNSVRRLNPNKRTKADSETGFERTALMNGKVPIRQLTKKAGREHYLDAELVAREIPLPSRFNESESDDEDCDWTDVPILEKQKILKEHEAKHIRENVNTKLTLDEARKDAKDFTPRSVLCKSLLNPNNNV